MQVQGGSNRVRNLKEGFVSYMDNQDFLTLRSPFLFIQIKILVIVRSLAQCSGQRVAATLLYPLSISR